MASMIKLLRGVNANFGTVTLGAGEPAFVTDTKKLYIGDGTDKVLINPDLPSLAAPLASPALTGTPTAPTATAGTNTTQVATTAFVKAAITALLNGAPGALDTLKELATALGDDANFSATITNALTLKAPLASPTFTGAPVAPTPATADNTTKIATTAYVQAQGYITNGTPLSIDCGTF